MGSSYFDLLPVIHANNQRVFSGGGYPCEVELVRCTQGVPRADLFAIYPDLALPENSLKKEDNPLVVPFLGNLERPSIPCRTHIGRLSVQPGESLFAQDGLGAEWFTETSLVGCSRELNGLVKTGVRCRPILAHPDVFGIKSYLPAACQRL